MFCTKQKIRKGLFALTLDVKILYGFPVFQTLQTEFVIYAHHSNLSRFINNETLKIFGNIGVVSRLKCTAKNISKLNLCRKNDGMNLKAMRNISVYSLSVWSACVNKPRTEHIIVFLQLSSIKNDHIQNTFTKSKKQCRVL